MAGTPERANPVPWLLAALPLAFLGYFFAYPLARILWRGLTPDGAFTTTVFTDVLSNGSLIGVAWFTLWQAAASTALTLVLALPGAYVFARYDFPGKRLLRAAVTIPFVLPTVVIASAFLALVGPDGVLGIDLQGTIWVILAAHVFYNYAVVIRTVGGLWAHLDPQLPQAARMLGASPWRAFTRVTLPLLRPAIAAASAIVFLFTFTSFGVILILGRLRFATLEVEIFRQTSTFLDLSTAAVLAIIQLVGIGAILIAYARYQDRRSVEQRLAPAAAAARRPHGRREWAFVAANIAAMAAMLGAPIAVLVERSLHTESGYGFGFYRSLTEETSALFVTPVIAVRNSLGFAAIATVLALGIGLMAATVVAYRRGGVSQWFDALLMLPLGTSAVTIGFGFLIALDWPVDLRRSVVIIPIAHGLVAIPFVVRTVAPVMRSVQHRLREAAAVLGAAPSRVWREIDLPIISRASLVGAGLAFAVSLGEFGATAFIVRPDTPTLPIAIFRLLGLPGRASFGRAMAMSTILMLVTGLAILAIERFRVGNVGEF